MIKFIAIFVNPAVLIFNIIFAIFTAFQTTYKQNLEFLKRISE